MNAAIQPLYLALGKFTPPVQSTPMIDIHRRIINEKQAELDAAYERIAQLEATLGRCQDYFEDATNGEPSREMELLIAIDEVLL